MVVGVVVGDGWWKRWSVACCLRYFFIMAENVFNYSPAAQKILKRANRENVF